MYVLLIWGICSNRYSDGEVILATKNFIRQSLVEDLKFKYGDLCLSLYLPVFFSLSWLTVVIINSKPALLWSLKLVKLIFYQIFILRFTWWLWLMVFMMLKAQWSFLCALLTYYMMWHHTPAFISFRALLELFIRSLFFTWPSVSIKHVAI